jgi:hypothetical protein
MHYANVSLVTRIITMSHNPYAPPTANVSDVVDPSSTPQVVNGLYSSAQIFLASFLGSPMAAAWIAASNFRKLNQPSQARNLIVWGAIGTVVVLVIALLLPDRIPHSVFPLAYSLGIRAAAAKFFDPIVKEQKASGSQMGSWWRVTGISILWGILVFALIFGSFIALEQFGVNLM